MKKIQLYRNATIYTPNENQSAREVAISSINALEGISDGEIVLARYKEDEEEEKTMICICMIQNEVAKWTFIDNVEGNEISKTPLISLSSVSSSILISPYICYDLGTISGNLTVSFDSSNELAGYCSEYIITFIAGQNCSITLPSNVIYMSNDTPVYTNGRRYEISVVNNCAIVGEFY